MATLHAQDVLRHDRKHAAQRVWPERGRAQKDADADAADVSAREIEPLAVEDPSQHELGDKRSSNRERRSFIALENAVEEVADKQDERDEERRDVAIVKARPAPDGNVKTCSVDGLNC